MVICYHINIDSKKDRSNSKSEVKAIVYSNKSVIFNIEQSVSHSFILPQSKLLYFAKQTFVQIQSRFSEDLVPPAVYKTVPKTV